MFGPNAYNMNMNMNPMNFFANNSFGGFNVGSNMFGNMLPMGGSIFQNAFGEPKYNAIAGARVANALMGCVMGMVSSSVEKKGPKVDHKEEVKDIAKKINDNTNNITELSLNIDKFRNDLKRLNGELGKLQTTKGDLERDIEGYKAQLKNKDTANIEGIKTLLAEAKNELKAIEGKISLKEKEIGDEEQKIRDAQSQISELEEQNEYLETDRKKHELDAVKDGDGNVLTRASKEKVEEWSSQNLEKNNNNSTPATKRELKGAMYQFTEAKKTSDKIKYGKIALKMMDSNIKLKNEYSTYYKGIENWLKDNPEDK